MELEIIIALNWLRWIQEVLSVPRDNLTIAFATQNC